MSKEYEAKPVEYTKDGLPVFTDQFQFYKWEKEKRKEIAEEIKDIVNEEAIQIAVELYKNEFRRLGDAIERLEEQVESIEKGIQGVRNDLDSIDDLTGFKEYQGK